MLRCNDISNATLDELYEDIVYILTSGEKLFVPRHNKNLYKFWWNEELSLLEKSTVENSRAWTAAGRPRQRDGITRSSAVAERPRDASCFSVVSFNIQRSLLLL